MSIKVRNNQYQVKVDSPDRVVIRQYKYLSPIRNSTNEINVTQESNEYVIAPEEQNLTVSSTDYEAVFDFAGFTGPTGAQGPQGAQSVVAATDPVTYDSGSQTVGFNTSYFDSTYLKLDASNDPVTGSIEQTITEDVSGANKAFFDQDLNLSNSSSGGTVFGKRMDLDFTAASGTGTITFHHTFGKRVSGRTMQR